jgi:hypothetical protein
MSSRFRVKAFIACAAVCSAASLHAMTVSKLSDDAFTPLREANAAPRVTIQMPLEGRTKSTLELERFEVWTPDGKVYIHSNSDVTVIAPPNRIYYRGIVNGDRESFVVLSVDPASKAINGLVNAHGKKYAVNGRRANNPRPGPNKYDDFLTGTDDQELLPDEIRSWTCAIDKLKPVESEPHATGIAGVPVKADGISGTQKYAIDVEIETDFELYQNAGSNSTTLTDYVTNLTAAVSTIYTRDLNTVVLQKAMHIYTTLADPWTAVADDQNTGDPGAGLSELIAYYHSIARPANRTTTSVVMLSGKNVPGGVAYEGQICNPGGADGGGAPNFFGPYAWCGAIGKAFGVTDLAPVPDPNASPTYAMPPERNLGGGNFSIQSYWPLEEYAHELGHNMGGHHTHCVAVTAGEFTASGFTDNASHNGPLPGNFVDHCYGHENFAGDNTCFGGSTGSADYQAGSAGISKGTIMSYCHNVFVVAGSTITPQSRFTFGQALEPSHHELDDFMLRAAGPLLTTSSGPRNIVSGNATFTISTITAPATVFASSTGNIASITAITGTYLWSITNGTITLGQGTNQITFTAGGSGTTTVTVAAFGTSKCGITDSKTIPVTVGLTPPTNVTATFDNVSAVTLNWTVAVGAAKYNIYRSSPTDYQNFTKLPTSPVAPPFSDTGVTAGNAYLYKIRSTDAAGTTESSDSNADYATAVVYTNPTLTANVSLVRAVDLAQIETGVNALRVLAKIGALAYPATTVNVTPVIANLFQDRRTALQQAYTALGFAGFLPFTDSPLVGGTTKIKAQHFTQMRTNMQ